jgi:hypothetical protein
MQSRKTASEDVAGTDGEAEIRVTMEVDGRQLVFTTADIDSISFSPQIRNRFRPARGEFRWLEPVVSRYGGAR